MWEEGSQDEWAGRREEDESDSDQSTLHTCKIVNK